MKSIKPRHTGFSLVETLAAAMLLSLGVVALVSLCTRSLARSSINRQYEDAWRVIDQQFTMIEYMGLSQFLENGPVQGMMEQPGLESPFTWSIGFTELETEGLYRISCDVMWMGAGRPQNVSASTIMSASDMEFYEQETVSSE